MIVVLADYKSLAESQCSRSLVRWSNSSGAPTQASIKRRNLDRPYGEQENGRQLTHNQHDNQGSSASLEEHECLEFGPSESNLRRSPGENGETPDRTTPCQVRAQCAREGVTTRARARRAKWLEAPGTAQAVEEIVSSAWEHAAA